MNKEILKELLSDDDYGDKDLKVKVKLKLKLGDGLIALFLFCFLFLFWMADSIYGDTVTDGDYSIFLEPEGYVIADVYCHDGKLGPMYGYISEEDYQSYVDGTLEGSLRIQNPYLEGRELTTPVSNIIYIEIGRYRDNRTSVDKKLQSQQQDAKETSADASE